MIRSRGRSKNSSKSSGSGLDGLPCGWWEDDSPRRETEINHVGFTRTVAREELSKLRPSHRHKGPESDDNEKEGCALYVFRYPLPNAPETDAYVKIAVKWHPKKRGIFIAKWYAFKEWGSGSD